MFPVDAAEHCPRSVEQTGDGGGIGDIGLRGDRAAPRGLDLRHQCIGGAGVAGIVDDDGEAVAGQALRDRSPEPAEAALGRFDAPALSHQPFLLVSTYLLAEARFNNVNGLSNQ